MTAFLSKGLQIHSDAFQMNDPEKAFGVTGSAACQTSGALRSLNESLSQVLLHGNIGLSLAANIPSRRTFNLQCQVCSRIQSSTVSVEKEQQKNFKQ